MSQRRNIPRPLNGSSPRGKPHPLNSASGEKLRRPLADVIPDDDEYRRLRQEALQARAAVARAELNAAQAAEEPDSAQSKNEADPNAQHLRAGEDLGVEPAHSERQAQTQDPEDPRARRLRMLTEVVMASRPANRNKAAAATSDDADEASEIPSGILELETICPSCGMAILRAFHVIPDEELDS